MKNTALFLFILILSGLQEAKGQKNDLIPEFTIPAAAASAGISMGAAHLLAPECYSWRYNTLSQLGAQHYRYAPVMNSGFIMYGSMINLYAANDLIRGKKNWLTSFPMLLYGTSMTFNGIFSTKSFEQDVAWSPRESGLHGIFAYSAVAGLTGSIIGNLITEENPKKLPLHLAGLGTVLCSSVLFMLDKQNQGVWQRTLWIGGITWMTIHYSF